MKTECDHCGKEKPCIERMGEQAMPMEDVLVARKRFEAMSVVGDGPRKGMIVVELGDGKTGFRTGPSSMGLMRLESEFPEDNVPEDAEQSEPFIAIIFENERAINSFISAAQNVRDKMQENLRTESERQKVEGEGG